MTAWLQQSSLRRNSSVRPCLLLHRAVIAGRNTTEASWTIRSPAAAATDGNNDAEKSSQMLLPPQLAVLRRDAFWWREPKSQNNPPRRTEPRPSGSLFWLTIRSALPYDGPLGFEPNNEPVRCCDRSELRPHLPKLRQEDARNQRPRTSVNTAKNVPTAPSRVRRNLTATRRCGTTTPAHPSNGRSGNCAPSLLPDNSRESSTEKRKKRRGGGSTPQKDKPDAPPEGAGT